MGLDSFFYLSKKGFDHKGYDKTYSSVREFISNLDENKEMYEGIINTCKEFISDLDDYEPRSEVGYFRKVNFLVNYFDYEENCSYMPISKEDLEQLKTDCEYVLQNHDEAEDYLPTMSGFFFGNTEYDEGYFENVEDVLNTVSEILENTDFDTEEITFYCWW